MGFIEDIRKEVSTGHFLLSQNKYGQEDENVAFEEDI